MTTRTERGGALAWFAGLVAVGVLLAAGYVWVVLNWSYSRGERAGWVQKLSHKGWFCKTWEGELAMIAVPGALPEKFFFTVWDDTIAEQINRQIGQRVALYYEEKVGIPTDCFGESRYIVTRVTLVDPPQGPGTHPQTMSPPGVPPPAGAPDTGAAPATPDTSPAGAAAGSPQSTEGAPPRQ